MTDQSTREFIPRMDGCYLLEHWKEASSKQSTAGAGRAVQENGQMTDQNTHLSLSLMDGLSPL